MRLLLLIIPLLVFSMSEAYSSSHPVQEFEGESCSVHAWGPCITELTRVGDGVIISWHISSTANEGELLLDPTAGSPTNGYVIWSAIDADPAELFKNQWRQYEFDTTSGNKLLTTQTDLTTFGSITNIPDLDPTLTHVLVPYRENACYKVVSIWVPSSDGGWYRTDSGIACVDEDIIPESLPEPIVTVDVDGVNFQVSWSIEPHPNHIGFYESYLVMDDSGNVLEDWQTLEKICPIAQGQCGAITDNTYLHVHQQEGIREHCFEITAQFAEDITDLSTGIHSTSTIACAFSEEVIVDDPIIDIEVTITETITITETVETTITNVTIPIDGLEERLALIEDRLSEIENRITALEQEWNDFKETIVELFEVKI